MRRDRKTLVECLITKVSSKSIFLDRRKLALSSIIQRILSFFRPAGGEYVQLDSFRRASSSSQPSVEVHAISTSSSASAGSNTPGTLASRLQGSSFNDANQFPDSSDPAASAATSSTSRRERRFDPYEHQEGLRNFYRTNNRGTASESTFFRSEEMSLIQLYIPVEVAQPTVSELGELGMIQFRDLNPDVNAFQRAFVNEIRRFDEMERQLRFFTSQVEKAEIPIRSIPFSSYRSRAPARQELHDLESRLSEHESRLVQMNKSYETLQRRYWELIEFKHVLREATVFFEVAVSRQDEIRASMDEPEAPLLDDLEAGTSQQAQSVGLGNVAGVIPRNKLQTFERILWRSLRGNLYMNTAEIDEILIDPSTDTAVEKCVFIIFAHGREILAKIKKISESMGATLYTIDSSMNQRREAMLDVMRHVDEFNAVLQNTTQTRRQELIRISHQLAEWMTIVKKEKAIYHTMNQFNHDINQKCLMAEGWCPSNEINTIQAALRAVTERSGSNVPSILNELRTHKEPPTYHKTNKFTAGFQAIVDAYGMAQYREVNPGLFTVISFPFLFAVMFGDVGHGILVLVLGLYLVLNERKLAHVEGE
ncbi:H(+)-transporting V0 sector ATPase subunit a, partial [Modicella reniformis]